MVDDPQRRAEQLVARYLDHVIEYEPVASTRLGHTGRDGELPDFSRAQFASRSRDLAVLAAEVDGARTDLAGQTHGAGREARHDLELLASTIDYKRFLLDVRPRYVLDPLAALEVISTGIHELLRPMPGDDLEEQCRRIEAAAQRARRVPVLLEQAGTLLASSPRPHIEAALQQLPGMITLVRNELPRHADRLGVDVSPARDAGEVAAEGLTAYAALLAELAEEPPADWRLGPEHHRVTLRTALGTAMDPVQIEDRARTWIAEITEEMAELSAATWADRFPGEPIPADTTERIHRTLGAVANTAVARHELVDEARRAVDEARQFALASGLTDVPPAHRLTVAELPPYLRGTAVAFITQAPPLRPESGCTYYLSPAPEEFNDAEAQAYLREYNAAQLRSLAIHEGYPGHFVQLEHASQHPRLARRLLSRPVFAEGWAVYIEREVLAAGFGAEGTSSVSADDYRITQRKLELRMATNALLDLGLHAGDLTDDDALNLLTHAAFQERSEAQGKLVRAKVTSGQLCAYFAGGEEFADLRAATESAEGPAFDVGRFHQRVLSQGTPTVGIAAEALADDAPTHRPFAATA